MNNPLVDSIVLNDTIENVRNVLAVVATAALADTSVTWDRHGPGVAFLLGLVDCALDEATQASQRWAREVLPEPPCSPTAGPSDAADPSPDPGCFHVTLALLPTDYARLGAVARSWGVLPETLARTLVVDGLDDIAKRK